MKSRNEGLFETVINWADLPATQVRPGVRRRIYCTDSIMICHHELEVGMSLNPHTHEDFDQLVFIAAGRANYYINGTPHDMHAGSFVLVPPGHEHYVEPTEGPCVNIDYFVPPRRDLLA
jgi:quercetin dioxygenase-like cupin family protein